jgi:hypothetical protein
MMLNIWFSLLMHMTYMSFFSPQLLQPHSRKIISPKIKKSFGRMAPGVRNSKRVRVSTQSDVQPSESKTRASKRLLVHDPTAPYDDNPGAEESNGPAVDENTPSEDGSVSVGHDNATFEAHIAAANDDNTLAEGKHFFHVVLTSILLILHQ